MGKRRHTKQRKTTRKKYHHTHDASLPAIEVKPNIGNEEVSYLPKIIVDCDAKISQRSLKKIQRYLRFADPHDLRHLSSIRVVAPTALIFPSKMTADGCYWPKWKERQPEIWLSSRLFSPPGIKSMCINFFILKRNRLFEVLFHELGHHKADRIRLVSKHKDEAYAEKYMRAYQQAWQQRQRRNALSDKSLNALLSLLLNRYFMLLYAYTIRNRDATAQRMYRIQLQYALRRLSTEEMLEQTQALFPQRSRKPKKKKWTHPLQQTSYREKFRLDEQSDET